MQEQQKTTPCQSVLAGSAAGGIESLVTVSAESREENRNEILISWQSIRQSTRRRESSLAGPGRRPSAYF